MKKKLFLLLCALLTSVGMWAQKDVTSLYITNATLSSLDGWDNLNFNTPVNGYHFDNKNKVWSNSTTGYATECYEGWDKLEKSEYHLTQTITLPAGHYTLVNYSFFREGGAYNTAPETSRAYLKAGDNQVSVKTLGSITAAGYANSQWEAAGCFDSKMYRNTLDFTIDADNTEIEIGVVGTFNTSIFRSWMILGMFELINNDIPATMDSPFDVTGYITNPGFEYRDMTGWTLSGDGALGIQNNNQGFKTAWYYGEKWQSAQSGALTQRSMSQTITDLPAGYYKLTANLGGNGTYIDLNGKTVNWTEDKDYTVGYVLSENEDLTITAGKTAEGTANWIHFDNFRLFYCGDVQAALNTLLGQLSGYEGTIPSAAYSALQTAVAEYDKDYSDVDELLAAIDDVQALYNAADLLKTPYATWLSAKSTAESNYSTIACITAVKTAQNTIVEAATDAATITSATSELNTAMSNYDAYVALDAKADILVAVANDNSDANSTLATAISTAATNVETCTTAGEINTATSTLKTAMQTYVFAANPVGDGAQFDCTFLMTNPDLTGLPTWQPAAGWASEETDGNSQVMVNDSKTVGDKSYFYEYWSNPAKASGNFALYNAVNLPAGTFAMSCYAFAENQYAASTVDGVYFYANDTQGSCVTATVLTGQTISFVNSSEQEVKIGLKTVAGNTRNWMGIGYVELYKVPAKEYELDENTAWESVNAAGDVKLTRTFKEGVNTVVFPFSMTQVEVESYFGAGSVVYQLSSYEEETETIHFTTKSGISANEPCLVDAKSTTHSGVEYTLVDRTIVAGTPSVVGTGVVMTGTYAASTTVAQGNYIVSGSNIYYVNSDNVKMKNTRAYITLGTPNPGARELILDLDGEATSISAIEAAEAETSGLKDGKYLIEGKIVLVKNGVKYDANGKKLN